MNSSHLMTLTLMFYWDMAKSGGYSIMRQANSPAFSHMQNPWLSGRGVYWHELVYKPISCDTAFKHLFLFCHRQPISFLLVSRPILLMGFPPQSQPLVRAIFSILFFHTAWRKNCSELMDMGVSDHLSTEFHSYSSQTHKATLVSIRSCIINSIYLRILASLLRAGTLPWHWPSSFNHLWGYWAIRTEYI
jgi:hypothetical protein